MSDGFKFPFFLCGEQKHRLVRIWVLILKQFPQQMAAEEQLQLEGSGQDHK